MTRRMPSIRQRIRLPLPFIVGMALSCTTTDRVTAPVLRARSSAASGVAVAADGACASTCVLFNTTAPLWSAISNPDSSAVPVSVADIRYAPSVGDSVLLQLGGDSTLIGGITPDESVDITDNVVHVRLTLHALTSASLAWKFSSTDTTTLHVSLNRALATGASGRVVLTATNSATVVNASRPWLPPNRSSPVLRPSVVRSPFTGAFSDVTPGCGTNEIPILQSGTFCGVSVTLSPFAAADAFLAAGATFQSDPGHGVSHPITIVFGQPVASVTVTAYDPTFDGNSMTAFTADSTAIGTVAFPGNHLPGTLTTQTGTRSGSISRVVLTPAPLDYVAYSMTVGAAPLTLQVVCTPAAPVRGTIVHCVASMSDSSAFVLTRLRSVVANTTVADITGTRPVPIAFDWKGRAAAATTVTVDGLVNGQPMTATGTFSITSRIGALAEWKPPAQPEAPPPPTPASGKPILATDYPGLRQVTVDSVVADTGGLGYTYHLFPEWQGYIIRNGPNTGIAYTLNLTWKVLGPAPAGIYISAALFPEDPFYKKQIGGGGFCTSSDMEILRAGVYAHESQHYTRGVQARGALRTHDQYEALVALIGTQAGQDVTTPIFESIRKQFADSIKVSDSFVDQTFPIANLFCTLRF